MTDQILLLKHIVGDIVELDFPLIIVMQLIVPFAQRCPGRKIVKPAITQLPVEVIEIAARIAFFPIFQIAKKRNNRFAIGRSIGFEVAVIHARHLHNRRINIGNIRGHIAQRAGLSFSGPAHDHRNTNAAFVKHRLAAPQWSVACKCGMSPIIRNQDHHRVVRELQLVEFIHNGANTAVHPLDQPGIFRTLVPDHTGFLRLLGEVGQIIFARLNWTVCGRVSEIQKERLAGTRIDLIFKKTVHLPRNVIAQILFRRI